MPPADPTRRTLGRSDHDAGRPADIVIIGAGAAGGVAALRLARAGVDVVCLEQGGWPDRASFRGGEPEGDLVARRRWSSSPAVRRAPADYPVDVSSSDMAPVNFNGVGGGTVLYNAQWPRMRPDDFRVASTDGVADDWPVSYEELQPYYEEIDRQFTVAGLGGNPAYPPGADPPLPPLPIGAGGMAVARAHARLGWHWWPESNAIASVDLDATRHRCAQRGTCGQGCGEGAKSSTDLTHWPAAIAAGARLVTGARVRHVTMGSGGRATGATWVDVDGREHFQAAGVVLLAANGIGTPRLLLASATAGAPDGLANSSGLVGRRLMLHPLASVVGLFPDDLETWRGQSGALIQSMQFYASDPRRGFVRGARWSLTPGGGPLRAAYAGGGRWGEGHHAHVRERLGRTLSWVLVGEDLPEDSNRVVLSATVTDAAGIPAPELHYRTSENSRALMSWHAERAEESLREAGAHHVEVVQHRANGHFMGTARMGDDPATSVVDRWGLAHDVPNLGIIDGSVFVTAGGVNPTSTISAIALRTAEHLLTHRGDPPRGKALWAPDPGRVDAVGPGAIDPGATAVRTDDVDVSPTASVVDLRPVAAPPLSPARRVALARVADVLVPGADGAPSASEVGVHGGLVDRVLQARGDLAPPLERALGALVGECAPPARELTMAAVVELRREDRSAHDALLLVVTSAYYMAPEVLDRLGVPADVSLPVDVRAFPAYVEEGLLDHVLELAVEPSGG